MSDPESAAPTIVASLPPVGQARALRAHAARTAAWLQTVWAQADGLPDFTWSALLSLPEWALDRPEALNQLACLVGCIFAAPTLRLCVDADQISRLRNAFGDEVLSELLAFQAPPERALARGPAMGFSPAIDARHWGAALLAASASHPGIQASLARSLGVSHLGLPAHADAVFWVRHALTLRSKTSRQTGCLDEEISP